MIEIQLKTVENFLVNVRCLPYNQMENQNGKVRSYVYIN